MEVCDRGVVLHNGELVFVGSAAEATRVHREVLEGRRKEAADAEHHEEAVEVTATITSVDLFDGDGAPLRTVEPGEALVIDIRVHHPVAVDGWHSSISIATPHGQQVFGTGTRRME